MTELLKHGNQGAPPSLSDMGILRHSTNSDLIQCLEKLSLAVSEVTAELGVAGSAIANMLPPKLCSTFVDYSEYVFLPYVIRQLGNT